MNNRALRRAGEIAGGSSGPDAPGRSKAVLDEHLFTELSRTNNELVNLQREMARRNAQLAVAQRQLQASEHRYLNLSACSPLGILEMDAKGLCLYSNPRWQADTGFEPEESLGEKGLVAARMDIFFIQDQGHVEAGDDEEGLDGDFRIDEGEAEKAVAAGVAEQDGERKKKSENPHGDETVAEGLGNR